MSGTNVYYYLQTLYTRFTQTQKKLNDTVTNLTIQCNNKFGLTEYINKVETFVNKFDNMIVSVDQINKDITEKVDYIVNNNQIFKDDIDSQLQQFNNDLSDILNELQQNLLDINNELILMNKTLDNKASIDHTHAIDDITNLQISLDNKASIDHVHNKYVTAEQLNTKANEINDNITEQTTTLNGTIDTKINDIKQELTNNIDEHISNITSIISSMNQELTNDINTKASIDHTHAIDDITNLQTSLDSKANTEHTHILSNITDLDISNYATVEQLNTKANVVHSHGDSVYHKTDVVDIIFPIGSIYISINNTDPGTIFGGTWEQIADKTMYAVYGKNDLGIGTTANIVENDVVQYTTNTSSDVKYVSCYMWYRTE